MILTADFETIEDVDKYGNQFARVWSWGTCTVDSEYDVKLGKDIYSFLDFILNDYEIKKVYFHNAKYDGEYIFYALHELGFKPLKDDEQKQDKSFDAVISDLGQFYKMNIYLLDEKKTTKKKTVLRTIEIVDSLKLLPMPLEKVAKAFNLPILKGEIDYDKYRPVGYEPDENEKAYQTNDVLILAMALNQMFKEGMNKLTIGSNALANYKKSLGDSKHFRKLFPICDFDCEIRGAYKGGYCYANPRFTNRPIGCGTTYDVNSLYPSRMRYCLLPYGYGIKYYGEYKEDKDYPLYIQNFSCCFKLKEGYFPTVQIKHSRFFLQNEYLTDSGSEPVDLCMTSVDIKLLFDHYDVTNVTWYSGYKFKARHGLFNDYIDYWSEQKIKAKEDKNGGLYTLAKLMLNNLYGKLGTNPERAHKIIEFDDKGKIRYTCSEIEITESIYVAGACFITAWARDYTIRSGQKIGVDRAMYFDTDSIHVLGYEPVPLDVDDLRLGAWKREMQFTEAYYIRQKTYAEKGYEPFKQDPTEAKWEIKCCGMQDSIKDNISIDNFKKDTHFISIYDKDYNEEEKTYKGSPLSDNMVLTKGYALKPKHVIGGILLEKKSFHLK